MSGVFGHAKSVHDVSFTERACKAVCELSRWSEETDHIIPTVEAQLERAPNSAVWRCNQIGKRALDFVPDLLVGANHAEACAARTDAAIQQCMTPSANDIATRQMTILGDFAALQHYEQQPTAEFSVACTANSFIGWRYLEYGHSISSRVVGLFERVVTRGAVPPRRIVCRSRCRRDSRCA
jgi:hypothetical protein